MKSEWMVSQVFAWGMKEPEYQVYRNIDKDGVDHEGNREYSGGTFDSQSAWEGGPPGKRTAGPPPNRFRRTTPGGRGRNSTG